MTIRLSGLTPGGKLSLGYLLAATVLVTLGGRDAEWFLTVLGFPLMYAPWASRLVFGETGPLPPAVGVPLLVLLWVGNAYLWGHAVAAVARLVGRRATRAGPEPTDPAGPAAAPDRAGG